MKELLRMSFAAYQKRLRQDPCLCSQGVRAFLEEIQRQKALNAMVRVYPGSVMAQASRVTEKLRARQAGPLAGLVVGLKDFFCYKGHPVQASSRILEGFVAPYSATAVKRLLRADAMIIGHQNSDEFGMGSQNRYSVYGPARHPLGAHLSPGGSSGGSAAAVAARLCHVALGTDTGGSVRQPAALNGLVGLKPTYGRISRSGVIAYASSFDTVGILSPDVSTCAQVLKIIAGQDKYDNTSSWQSVPDYAGASDYQVPQARIGYLSACLEHPSLQKAVKERTLLLLKALREAGHAVTAVEIPYLEYALPAYYLATTAEASANLARYDGVRYGYRSSSARGMQEVYTLTRSEGFGQEVKRRILLGTLGLSADYAEGYYQQAQKVRTLLRRVLCGALTHYDFLLLPTTPTTASGLNPKNKDPLQDYLADLFTVPASLAGLPAISVPNGMDEQGLPIGIQCIGKAFAEEKLLTFSRYLLRLTALS